MKGGEVSGSNRRRVSTQCSARESVSTMSTSVRQQSRSGELSRQDLEEPIRLVCISMQDVFMFVDMLAKNGRL